MVALPGPRRLGVKGRGGPGHCSSSWGQIDQSEGGVEVRHSCNRGLSPSHRDIWSWAGPSKLSQIKAKGSNVCTPALTSH